MTQCLAKMKQIYRTPSGASTEQSSARSISSKALLAGENRLRIEHDGVEYLLQLTRQGKLILTK